MRFAVSKGETPTGKDPELRERWRRWLLYYVEIKELKGPVAIAKALGVKHPTISNIIKARGYRCPGIDLVVAMSETWKRPLYDFMETDPPTMPRTLEERVEALHREERRLARLLDETRAQLSALGVGDIPRPRDAPSSAARPVGRKAGGGP